MEQVTNRRWRMREADSALIEALKERAGLSPLKARLLVNRGITDAVAAERYLTASLADLYDPFLLNGMEQAVVRLVQAQQQGEKVCVYGDYDVDGITSVALLVDFFGAVGISCCYHIPNRLDDGYGISAEGVAAAVSSGARLIVTVDCGITALAEARLCREQGIDLIITDHHMPGELIPEALAVINPLLPESSFPFKGLAGVGVAFNLVVALRSRLREMGMFTAGAEPNLRSYLDLVALGTIADLVPLLDENRVFVRHGLRQLTVSERPGIKALKVVAGVSGEVSCGAVGFRLAPRINAVGRLEDATSGVELLLAEDFEQASQLAAELDRNNAERQGVEQDILRQALAMVRGAPAFRGRKSIVLASPEWHPGVVGIVASRMVDLYHRPTVLIALQEGSGRGSGRSIPNFHLHDALRACSEHLLKFGGHKYAAGLAIDEATLAAFVDAFEEVAAGTLTVEDLLPELAVDAQLEPAEVTVELARDLASLAPFGMANPEPVFLLRDLAVVEQRVLKGKHLRLRVRHGDTLLEAIGFNMTDHDLPDGRIDMLCTLGINEWNGRSSAQMRIRDLRSAEVENAA